MQDSTAQDSHTQNPTAQAFSDSEIQDKIRRMLIRGVVDPKHDWHWPVLATATMHDQPEAFARVVVLRAWDAQTNRFEIHSDARAEKLLQLQAQPAVSTLLFYDARSRTQLRVRAQSQVHVNDEISSAAWQKLSSRGREQYRGAWAPGSPLSQHNEVQAFEGQHFAVIILQAFEFDYLHLAREGHVRVRFTFDAGSWLAVQLVP